MRTPRLIRPKFWLAKVVTGFAFLAMFAYSAAEYQAFEAIAVHATGKVLSVSRESHATGRRGGRVNVERPVVRFTVPGDGKEVEGTAKVMSRQTFVAGEQVALEFDPRRPQDTVRVAAGLSLLDVACGLLGLVLVFFGASEQIRWRRQIALVPLAPVTPLRSGKGSRDIVQEPLA